MNVTLGEEQMRAVVTKAILEGLGEEQKTLIFQQAIEHLLGQPERAHHSYSTDKRNRLQIAFDQAAEVALQKLAREEFAKPENLEKLRAALAPTIVDALAAAQGGAVRRAVANAIGAAFDAQENGR